MKKSPFGLSLSKPSSGAPWHFDKLSANGASHREKPDAV